MALIICKQCGKKISDTTDKCIHCGCVIGSSAIDNSDSDTNLEENQETKEKESKLEFYMLAEEERIILEKEFLESDKWARKYRRSKEEAPKFSSPLFFCIGILLISLRLFVVINEITFDVDPANPFLLNLFLVLLIALGVLLVGMFLYAFFLKRYLKLTKARYIYMKRFQKWLEENKNMEYIPPLVTLKDKKIFQNIKIK